MIFFIQTLNQIVKIYGVMQSARKGKNGVQGAKK